LVVMNTSAKTFKQFVIELKRDYPQFKFKSGSQDHWSPKSNTITYKSEAPPQEKEYGILHELAHAQLGHTNYHSDFELLMLESAAWDLAAKIGCKYDVKIDDDHIQSCLDTYRDWLHARSTCPVCRTNVLQKDPYHYRCFNCQAEWKVTGGRFVRPYRRIKKSA